MDSRNLEESRSRGRGRRAGGGAGGGCRAGVVTVEWLIGGGRDVEDGDGAAMTGSGGGANAGARQTRGLRRRVEEGM